MEPGSSRSVGTGHVLSDRSRKPAWRLCGLGFDSSAYRHALYKWAEVVDEHFNQKFSVERNLKFLAEHDFYKINGHRRPCWISKKHEIVIKNQVIVSREILPPEKLTPPTLFMKEFRPGLMLTVQVFCDIPLGDDDKKELYDIIYMKTPEEFLGELSPVNVGRFLGRPVMIDW